MLENIKIILKISRYRFWFYVAGPFLIGSILGISNINQLLSFEFFILFIYFLLPVNFFIYSINDYFDRDTDAFNPKKDSKEIRYSNKLDRIFKYGTIFFVSVTIIIFLVVNNTNRVLLSLFLFLSLFYSAPPLRFKAKPFVDSLSNVLYAIPGFIGFYLFTNYQTPLAVIYISFAYTAAMHLFSAVPDIEADKKANLKTTAVVLGKNVSLVLCTFLWGSIAILILQVSFAISIIALVFPFVSTITLLSKKNVTKIYWLFPYINTFSGFLIFWILVINKFQ